MNETTIFILSTIIDLVIIYFLWRTDKLNKENNIEIHKIETSTINCPYKKEV